MPIRIRQDTENVTLKTHVNNIESILSMIDVNPAESRAHTIEGFRWIFPWGSVKVEVNVIERAHKGYMQVSAPLLYLPLTNREPLYRALLEQNMEMTSAALAVFNDLVYIFSERSLDGLDTEEARQIITQVAYYADELDNRLVNEYGGRLYES